MANKPVKSLTGAAIAAMVAVTAPFVAGWEGKRNTPYFDAVGIKKVCYGETLNVEDRRYSDKECDEKLRTRLATDFGPKVMKSSPGIENNTLEFGAHASFSYNVGSPTYAKSSVSRLYREGKRVEACRYMSRYKYAGGRVLAGLVFRRDGDDIRIGESEMCIAGVLIERLGINPLLTWMLD